MNWVPVGKVIATQGLRGEVKVDYYNEVKEDFLLYTSLFVVRDGEPIEIKPSRVRFLKGFVYVIFAGFKSIEEVSFLVGRELCVNEDQLPLLGDSEYYEYQLINLFVVGKKGEKLGKVKEMLHTGANEVLVVEGKEEFMVPMVEGFIIKIDVGAGYIEIDEEALKS